jgi:hypothetical protein
MKKWVQQLWWVMPVLLVAGSGLAAWKILQTSQTQRANIVECTNERASEFKCWQQRYEAIVEQDSPKAAFTDVRKAYEEVGYVKSNCHQIAHVIGRAASKKYDDISKAYNEGDNFCWSGYYHGVIEGIAKDMGREGLITNINSVCAGAKKEHQYSFYHYNCVHGMGHGLMVVQNNELFESLETCNKLEGSWEQTSCHGGVFMENIMSNINPDHATKYLKNDDPLYPCTAVAEQYKQSCFLMQTSHALVVLSQDYSQVFNLCGTVGVHAATCFQSLGRDASGSTSSDVERTRALCMLGPSHEARMGCVIGAVKDFISYHHSDKQAMEFCNSLAAELQSTCTSTAIEYYKTF